MEDQCPACERDFLALEDYPLIYVAGFRRESIPGHLRFPSFHKSYGSLGESFYGPKHRFRNDLGSKVIKCPPPEVMDFFRQHPIHEKFKDEPDDEFDHVDREESKYKSRHQFEVGGNVWILRYGTWEGGEYSCHGPGQREIILARLNPYLDSLDNLVGKEVSKKKLLPRLPRNKDCMPCDPAPFDIPKTVYNLVFFEGRTSNEFRTAILELVQVKVDMECGWGNIQPLLAVGHLEYEGRIRKSSR